MANEEWQIGSGFLNKGRVIVEKSRAVLLNYPELGVIPHISSAAYTNIFCR
jgi:hypothetical protein